MSLEDSLKDAVLEMGADFVGTAGLQKHVHTCMFKLHVDSGVVDIPQDPALMYYLRQANARLQPYAIPVEEVEALAIS